jgi:two-component system, response regulator PdtaR
MNMEEKKNILIVEDDLILAMMNAKFIESLGHAVINNVQTGEEAVEFAKENDFDLVLMDIRLKGKMDGIEAMHEINNFKKIPAIYISGNSDPETKQRASETNMVAFCVKPFSYEELQIIINNV